MSCWKQIGLSNPFYISNKGIWGSIDCLNFKLDFLFAFQTLNLNFTFRRSIEELLKLLPGPHLDLKRVKYLLCSMIILSFKMQVLCMGLLLVFMFFCADLLELFFSISQGTPNHVDTFTGAQSDRYNVHMY